MTEDGGQLVRGENRGSAAWQAAAGEGFELAKGSADDMAEGERERARRLVLGRGADAPPAESGEEPDHDAAAHVRGVAHAREGHESAQPGDVRLLGERAVVQAAQLQSQLADEEGDAGDTADCGIDRRKVLGGTGLPRFAPPVTHASRSSGLRTPWPPRLMTWV